MSLAGTLQERINSVSEILDGFDKYVSLGDQLKTKQASKSAAAEAEKPSR
jgi:hypothetical protein